MGKNSAEYALLTLLVCVAAYLVVTPLAERTANKMNEAAMLFDKGKDR